MRKIIDKIVTEWGNYGDAASISLFLGSLLDMLPSIAAILSIIWFSLRIFESETVQSILMRRRIKNEKKDTDRM